MSLWSKPVAAITFEDIKSFCEQKPREGLILDYKSEIPNNLAKTVAAFANTAGGLIVLGVDSDANNQPKWPPIGMQDFSQFTERITQSCGTNIYPPVRPSIGMLIPNPYDPATTLAVLRVDQSREAPHAIDGGRKIYVRTGDVCDPFSFADIHQIERLLNSRRTTQQLTRATIDRHLDRFRNFAQKESDSVAVWWFIAPYYPGGSVRALEDCRNDMLRATRRGPDGAWGLVEHSVMRETSNGRLPYNARTEYVGVGTSGDFMRARWFFPNDADTGCALSAVQLTQQTRKFLVDTQSLYGNGLRAHPGLLRISIGFENLRCAKIRGFNHEIDEGGFPDPTFSTEAIVTFDEFIRSNFAVANWPAVFTELMSEIAHAFDLPKPPPTL